MGTFVNALLGAVVAVVLAFLPFSTVIGGAVTGFLEGPNGRNGAIAGALAGLLSLLPLAGVGLFFLGLLGFGFGLLGLPFGGFAAIAFFFTMFATAMAVYTVGFSALGGFLGAVLAQEFPGQRTDVRETIGMGSDEYRSQNRYRSQNGHGTTAGRDRDLESDRRFDSEVDANAEMDARTDRDRDLER